MNILEIENGLKDLSDSQLQGAMQGGAAPQYLVLSEMQRRKQMRDKYANNAQQPQRTIAEEMMGGISQVAPEMEFADGGIIGFAKGGETKKAAEARYAKGIEDATYKSHWSGKDIEPAEKPDVRMPRKYASGGAIDLIADFEKFRPTAYKPTPDDPWTIGYGTTKGVKEGDTITEEEARRLLERDVSEADSAIDRLVTTDLTPSQRDALTSLIYNVGPSAFAGSKAREALNAGDMETFMREAFSPEAGFVNDSGKPNEGLIARRAREQELFSSNGVPRGTDTGIAAMKVAAAQPGEAQDYANEPVPEEQRAPQVTAAEGIAGLQGRAPVESDDSWLKYITSILMSQANADALPPNMTRMAEGGQVKQYMHEPRRDAEIMLPNGNGVRTRTHSYYGEEVTGKKEDVRKRMEAQRDKDGKVKAQEGLYIPPEYEHKVEDGIDWYKTPEGWRTRDDLLYNPDPRELWKARKERELSGWSEGMTMPSTESPFQPVTPWQPQMPSMEGAYGAQPAQPPAQQPSAMDWMKGLYGDAVDYTSENILPWLEQQRQGAVDYVSGTTLPYWDERLNFSGTKGDGITEGIPLPDSPVKGVDLTGGQKMPPTSKPGVTEPSPGEPEMVDKEGKIKDSYISWLRDEAAKGPTGQQKLAQFLMHTGIGMMASNDPSTLRNLGIGGLQGLKAVSDMEKGEAKRQEALLQQEGAFRRAQEATGSKADRALRDAINAQNSFTTAKKNWEEANAIRLMTASPQERDAIIKQAISPGGELYEAWMTLRAAQQAAESSGYKMGDYSQPGPSLPQGVTVEID